MAQLGQTFDASTVDPSPRFDPIPAGEYTVTVTSSEMKRTKDGAGQYIELALEIQGGEFAGRRLFDRLNLWNSNRQAVEIAQRQLSQICHAVGVLQVTDSEQLHHKPCTAMVSVKKAEGNYSASNDIKGYKPAAGAFAPARAPFQPPAQATPAAAAATHHGFGGAGMPWDNKAAA